MAIQSELDQIKDRNVKHTLDVIVEHLENEGVPRIVALATVEDRMFFRIDQIGRVIPEAGELRARGSTDEHLRWFAREFHLYNPEIGGEPVPFGSEQPPATEGETEYAARLQREVSRADSVRDRLRAEALEGQRIRQKRELEVEQNTARPYADPRLAL